jgi:DUF1680 family protein
MNRRHFLQSATAATLAASTRLAAAATTTLPLAELPYNQVELLDGPLRRQFDHNHQLFLSIPNDDLLKPFRQLTGQPAPGNDLGGWYSPSPLFDFPRNTTGYVPGATFGQWLSALSRAYAITADPATQQKVHALTRGYAATISPRFYSNYCLPAYIYDKLVIGLLDAHQLTADPLALDALNRTTDTVLPFLPDHALTRPEMIARPHPSNAWTWDESFTLPENLFLAFQRGAGPRYRLLARRFLQDQPFFQPLSENQNVLPGLHAYSHVNALSSAMQSFLVDGSQMHFNAARNGFRFVQQQSWATGGWGPGESFRKPSTDELANTLVHSHASFETPCGAYAHFKITRYLLRATADSTYGDSMEQVLHNTILGATPIQRDGTTFYYADNNNNATKVTYTYKWPCCSGTFPQLTADYFVSTFFRTSANGLAVNLYTPSRVHFRHANANITLAQTTAYPSNGNITLTLNTDRAAAFPLDLRIPAWAGPATRVLINGQPTTPPQPGSWLTLQRTWRNHDRVELELDMPLRLVPLDATHPNLVALSTGPLALFAILPSTSALTRQQLLTAQRPNPAIQEWTVATATETIRFVPFASITTEHYRLYHQLDPLEPSQPVNPPNPTPTL